MTIKGLSINVHQTVLPFPLYKPFKLAKYDTVRAFNLLQFVSSDLSWQSDVPSHQVLNGLHLVLLSHWYSVSGLHIAATTFTSNEFK
jgi:hypothetical protein